MPDTSILSLPVLRFERDAASSAQDLVAVEEPLLIRLNGAEIATIMRTPGHDAELAAGFLFSEGVITSRPHIVSTESGVVELSAADAQPVTARGFYVNSSCGVCGRASIDALIDRGCARLDDDSLRAQSAFISTLPEILRKAQRVFDHTGGLHAAGLFQSDSGEMIGIREDVGRHNAVDKLVGAALLTGALPLNRHTLMLSGRLSFELVQKAVTAGIPIVAAVGAPSSLAVQTALRFGLTLIGFVRDGRFNVYSGSDRITQPVKPL